LGIDNFVEYILLVACVTKDKSSHHPLLTTKFR